MNERLTGITFGGEKVYLQSEVDAIKKQIREEERANIPSGFVRQWINEDRTTDKQKMVSNEDIRGFIQLGYDS